MAEIALVLLLTVLGLIVDWYPEGRFSPLSVLLLVLGLNVAVMMSVAFNAERHRHPDGIPLVPLTSGDFPKDALKEEQEANVVCHFCSFINQPGSAKCGRCRRNLGERDWSYAKPRESMKVATAHEPLYTISSRKDAVHAFLLSVLPVSIIALLYLFGSSSLGRLNGVVSFLLVATVSLGSLVFMWDGVRLYRRNAAVEFYKEYAKITDDTGARQVAYSQIE